jgi:WD40 repeat protein
MVFKQAYAVVDAAFSPDGKHVATGGIGTVQTGMIWDMETGAAEATLTGHSKSIFSVSYSADGTRIVTTSSDLTAKVWNERGENLATLIAHTKWLRSGAFSPDGTHIVTAGDDGTVCLWVRRHSDCRYNALLLPECWLSILLSFALILSLWRDKRRRLIGRHSR